MESDSTLNAVDSGLEARIHWFANSIVISCQHSLNGAGGVDVVRSAYDEIQGSLQTENTNTRAEEEFTSSLTYDILK